MEIPHNRDPAKAEALKTRERERARPLQQARRSAPGHRRLAAQINIVADPREAAPSSRARASAA